MDSGGSASGRASAVDRTASTLLDYQTRELQRYRDAMRKLGQDVLALRQQVRGLEADNARLRRDHQIYAVDGQYRIPDTMALDDLTKHELATRYANLRMRYDQQADELADYKDRIHKLQNDLIRKNDVEINDTMFGSGPANNELRRQLDEEKERAHTLEATRSRQSVAIADLEREITSLKINRYDDSANLAEENIQLRREIGRLRDELELRPNRDIPIEWGSRLENAEARVRALEQQLLDEAHRWNLERNDLLEQLHEARKRWMVYQPPPAMPPQLRPIVVPKRREKAPWRPHHGPLTERQRKEEKRLYKE